MRSNSYRREILRKKGYVYWPLYHFWIVAYDLDMMGQTSYRYGVYDPRIDSYYSLPPAINPEAKAFLKKKGRHP